MNISLFQWRRFVYCTEIETRKIKYENEFDDYSAITVNSAPPLDIKNINIRNISWLLSDNGRSPLCPRTSSELSSAVVQTGAGQSACKHFMIFIIFFMIIFYGSVREQTCQMHTLTGSLLTLTLYVHNTDITHRNDSAWCFLPNKPNENLFLQSQFSQSEKINFFFVYFADNRYCIESRLLMNMNVCTFCRRFFLSILRYFWKARTTKLFAFSVVLLAHIHWRNNRRDIIACDFSLSPFRAKVAACGSGVWLWRKLPRINSKKKQTIHTFFSLSRFSCTQHKIL